MPSLSELITKRAEMLNQSDETAARAVGVSASTMNRWRLGLIAPQRNKVPALAEWLGVSEQEVRAAIDAQAEPSDAPTMAELITQVAELAKQLRAAQAELSELRGAVEGRHHEAGKPQPASRTRRRQ